MSLLYYYYGSTQTNGVIHGEKAMSLGSDGTSGVLQRIFPIQKLRSWQV